MAPSRGSFALLATHALLDLIKLRVVAMLTFTAWVGMLLAVLHEGMVPSVAHLALATLGIFLASASSACFNQIFERVIDAQMKRTEARPLPTGALSTTTALVIAVLFGTSGLALLYVLVNPLTSMLTLFSLVFYSFVYTLFLKRHTPQNIVIGGLAGALPPLLGWAAISNAVHPLALQLVLIIYVWTPSHFWALSVARVQEYRHVGMPMLPVAFGVPYTKTYVIYYSVLLAVVSILPWVSLYTSWFYLLVATALNARYLFLSYRFYKEPDGQHTDALKLFTFSIRYLLYLFALLVADKVGLLLLPLAYP